jgi:hypothetical protein
MNILPCDFIKSIDGTMGALGLIGLPFAGLGAFLHVLSQWPGQGLWLIAGFLLPWRIKATTLGAAALAAFGFFGYWIYFALENHGRTDAPDSCSLVNEALFTFATALIAFLAGQALRLAKKDRRPAVPAP